MTYEGTFVYKTSDKEGLNGVSATHGLTSLYKEEIEMRYKELRDLKIFTTDNIVGLLQKWVSIIGFDNYKKNLLSLMRLHLTVVAKQIKVGNVLDMLSITLLQEFIIMKNNMLSGKSAIMKV